MIDKKFKSSKIQKELSEMVIENYEERKERSILERKWNNFYNLYRGINTRGTYAGRADLDWALAYLTVEIIVPRLYNVLFPRAKWFDIVGVEQTDEKQASILSAYLRQKLERDIHFRRKMIPLLRYCTIYGTMIGKTPYRREEKMVPHKVKPKITNLYGMLAPDIEEKKIITFDSIDLEMVDIFDFYPADDMIDNIEDQPFVIHKTVEYISTLYKKEYDPDTGVGQYENLNKIHASIKDKDTLGATGSENSYKTYRKAILGMKSYEENSKLPSVDFIEYQGVYEDEDIVVIVANDGENNPVVSAEVLNTPDKQKTFVMGKYQDIPGEFWGMPILERVEKSIYELNDRVNQTMDATSLIISPMWLNSDSDIPEGTLRVRPGRVITSSTDKGLTPLHPPVEILTPAYKAIQALISSIQDVTGATRFLGGSAQTPELQRTATGIISIIREANARLNLVIQGIEDMFTVPFLRKATAYAQFYAEKKEMVRIVGKAGIEYNKVDPASILGDWDYRPIGSSSIGSQEIETQQLINYLNIIAKIPGVIQNFDIMKLAAKIGEKMLGLDDLDELILVNNREEEEKEKAISENQAAMEGIPPVLSSNENHRLHLEIHEGFLLDPRAQEVPRAAELLQTHINDHKKYEAGQGMMPLYTPGNSGAPSPGNQPEPGIPAQEMPSTGGVEGAVKQMSQPSQEGMI